MAREPEDAARDASCPSTSTSPAGPLVSIVVPTLDEERELPLLLDHLTALHGRWQLIMADGGSRDATPRIAREHPARPRRLARLYGVVR